MIAAGAPGPEERERSMAVGCGDVGRADGVIRFEVGAACCVGDSRSPWRAEAAGKQTWRWRSATRAVDHGAMAWRGESVRMKISRP